jgi:hypothetical protein
MTGFCRTKFSTRIFRQAYFLALVWRMRHKKFKHQAIPSRIDARCLATIGATKELDGQVYTMEEKGKVRATRRHRHSAEVKAQAVNACMQPGVLIAVCTSA